MLYELREYRESIGRAAGRRQIVSTIGAVYAQLARAHAQLGEREERYFTSDSPNSSDWKHLSLYWRGANHSRRRNAAMSALSVPSRLADSDRIGVRLAIAG